MSADAAPISDAVIVNLAKLSRLALDEGEVERMRVEVAEILETIEHLRTLDLRKVEPTLHPVVLATNAREDVAGDLLAKDDLLKNAPESNDDGVVVPRVVG